MQKNAAKKNTTTISNNIMTPAEKSGYFVGQWFKIIKDGNFIKGSIVELEDDDSSDCPRFNLIEGDIEWRTIKGSGRKEHTSLGNVKPLPRTMKPLSELPEKWYVKVTPKQSEELQLALFEKGVTWLSGSSLVNHLKDSFLIFNFYGDNSLTRANYIESIESVHPLLNYSELWNYETKEANEIKPKYELVDGCLPSMKTASEMGFKEGDEFEVVIDDVFFEGDVVALTKDDNTTFPYFSRDIDGASCFIELHSLKPYTSQTVDESRVLTLLDANISLKEEIKELTETALQISKKIKEKEIVIENNTNKIKANLPESIKKFKDYL